MHSLPYNIRMLAAAFAVSISLTASTVHGTLEGEDLATVKSWLPYYHSRLQLIFEYDAEDPAKSGKSSEHLHTSVDRAGPTVVILEVQTPYHDEPRLIGGYNPYKWKTWTGRYESNPGRFIFDLDKNKKWERTEKRKGSFRANTSEYGLQFGNGDLIIHPDLRSGNAKNQTFAPPSNQSVLVGQAGDFLVNNLRVYKVIKEQDSAPQPAPLPQIRTYEPIGPVSPVPDHAGFLFECSAALIGLALFTFIFRRS